MTVGAEPKNVFFLSPFPSSCMQPAKFWSHQTNSATPNNWGTVHSPKNAIQHWFLRQFPDNMSHPWKKSEFWLPMSAQHWDKFSNNRAQHLELKFKQVEDLYKTLDIIRHCWETEPGVSCLAFQIHIALKLGVYLREECHTACILGQNADSKTPFAVEIN